MTGGIFAMSLDAIYSTLGVVAVSDLVANPFTVIDKTSGVELTPGGQIEMPTIVPAAAVRVYELAEQSVQPKDLISRLIVFNGVSWRVVNVAPKPTPEGEAMGEVYLILRKP